jgi:hypothetical protein
MGFLLKRHRDSLSVNDWDWHYLIQLARANGWVPPGRSQSDNLKAVPQRDAQALVAALERALPKIPDENPDFEDRGLSNMPEDPMEWFSGDGRIIVRHFIAFCRGGAFVVE